jgi:tetratricopeptide (TPR) repeat protein
MTTKFWLISLVAVIASFFGGFLMANAINRTELNTLKAENERLKNTARDTPDTGSRAALDDSELKAKIAQADQNPSDFDFQKKLGIALSKYASIKQDTDLLKESVRILTRANSLQKDDADILVGLANAHFDLGFFQKDNAELTAARGLYTQALAARPDDPEIRTDLGLTYFLYDPPDDKRALAEFQRSLKTDPKHEKTLEFTVQALIRTNRLADAERYLSQLRIANPSNETLPELASRIEQAKGTQAK